MSVGVRGFQVRDFQASDFDSLWRIDQECFAPGISYSRMELRSYMRRQGSFTLVAVPAGEEIGDTGVRKRANHSIRGEQSAKEIAGFIVGERDRGIGHIITIDVIADARRHGVGSLLLEAAEDRLRAVGCGLVELEAAVDNLSALAFYKRHGYSVVQSLPRYYSNGVDALVLQKNLAAR